MRFLCGSKVDLQYDFETEVGLIMIRNLYKKKHYGLTSSFLLLIWPNGFWILIFNMYFSSASISVLLKIVKKNVSPGFIDFNNFVSKVALNLQLLSYLSKL